jgi:hypothetical protein
MQTVQVEAGLQMPASVKWIVGLSVAKLALFGLKVLTPTLFLLPFQSELILSFRRGWLEGAGAIPDSYGPDQAAWLTGNLAGTFLPGAVLSAMVIFFVSRGRLSAIQAIAVILASGSVLMLSFGGMFWWTLTAILAFLPQTKAYFAALLNPEGNTAAS